MAGKVGKNSQPGGGKELQVTRATGTPSRERCDGQIMKFFFALGVASAETVKHAVEHPQQLG